MEYIIDPTSDWIFDAAVIDISHKGVSETKPLSDDDWLKVERGGYRLAESTNLLKIPRRMVPPEEEGKPHQPGEPELPPEQIQAEIEKDRALWYKHADGLKAAALEAGQVAKARDFDRTAKSLRTRRRLRRAPAGQTGRSSRQFQKLPEARRCRVDRARGGRIRPRVHRALDGH
jgi:hypothetical protein